MKIGDTVTHGRLLFGRVVESSETFGYHSLKRLCQTGSWALSLVKFGETFEDYGTGRLVVKLLSGLWFMIAFIV